MLVILGRVVGVLSGASVSAIGCLFLPGGRLLCLWSLFGLIAVAVACSKEPEMLVPVWGVSFIFGGWYFLGAPGLARWLGVGPFGYLLAAGLIAAGRSASRRQRRVD